MKDLKRFWLFTLIAWATASRGALPPMQDPDEAVFSSKVVAVVSPQGDHAFKVERICNGSLPIGTVIQVPAFKLVTWTPEDQRPGTPTPVPMTDSTRILMFLKPDEKNPAQYAVTDDGVAFFYRDVSKIDELDALGSHACAQYATWLAACAESDRDKRVGDLYPFALRGYRSYLKRTLEVLAKTEPEAGDYFAEQLQKAATSEQGRLLYCVEQIHSAKLHAAVIVTIDAARKAVADAQAKAGAKMAPADLRESAGIIDVGLYGLASFDDPEDMAYFRGAAQFIVDHRLRGGLENCLRMMRQHPSAQNVPLLLSIWDHFKDSLNSPDTPMFLTINLAASLGRQKQSEVVPALLDLLGDHDAHDTALAGLQKVTGQKFQTDSEWKERYKP